MWLVPWSKEADWREANDSIRFHLRRYAAELTPVVVLARRQQRLLESVFPLMEALCAETCPACADPCCSHASVYYDFRDLLYLQILQLPLSGSQPRPVSDKPCRHLAGEGCKLSRATRPWICTWYLCPAQRSSLGNRRQAFQNRLERTITVIKQNRRSIEAAFIRTVAPAGTGRG